MSLGRNLCNAMKEGWEIKKLGEVCEVISGGTPRTNNESYWGGNNMWVTPAELNGDKWISHTERNLTDEGVRSAHLQLMPKGTVLLSSRAPIGKIAITNVPMYCNQGFKNLVCGDKINNLYLYWYLHYNKEYIKALGTGATFKEISKKVVSNIDVLLPPISEQTRIVEELDLLNGILDKKRQQLKELDALCQSIFYDMFGDPITNEKRWKKSSFGNEFKIMSGGTPKTNIIEYWENGDISWIGSNMCHNNILYENDGKYITKKGLDNSSAKLFCEGFVLVALVGATIGKTALLKFDTATNQNIAGIDVKANNSFTPEYVYYYLQNLYCLFEAIGGDKFKMANLSFVRNLQLHIPPLTLQTEFANKIKSIEHQKELITQSIAETQTLLDSRMDYYFN